MNFPENLNISPSVFPENQWVNTTSAINSDDVFGFAAQREGIEKYGIAGRIWEAAYVLSIYVNPPSNLLFDPPFATPSSSHCPRTILELGSGAGMTSARIAETLTDQDMLIVTDLPEVCPLLASNLKACRSSTFPESSIHVRPLAWGEEPHAVAIASELLVRPNGARTLTHVLCSDLIYFPELLAPLLRSLLQVTSPPFSSTEDPTQASGVTVVISYKLRSLSKEAPFWSAFGLWFTFKPVLVKDTSSGDGTWQRFGASSDDPMFIFIANRRPESYAWKIPTHNSDLLAGRGAVADDSAKADDTFETLLFMTLEGSEA
ncbi:putative lysine methyltransferase [Lyophyllum shimeji]|uniref:Lysine methyltransferase n=1 Tax=Lyophyllum shimeji TaxID=47721 RepID=A0A9P3PQQ4_LYOSH|nr:putative lysine methyltransferase [Lyophyllum shimeji]